jgi:chaperonin cofactor prefoldin
MVKRGVQDEGRNLGEPTGDELEGAHAPCFRALIGRSIGTPDPELAASLTDVRGNPMSPDDLFVFPAELSNTYADFYGTYMTPDTLRNYSQDAKEGRALLHSHDLWDLPIGQSFDGRVVEDTSEGVAVEEKSDDGDRSAPAPAVAAPKINGVTGPVTRFFADWYIVRGTGVAKVPNDNIIRGIETRTIRDQSIQFFSRMIRCDICKLNLYGGECPHIPLVEYDGRLCLAAVEDGRMIEGSLVSDGATPDAGVLAVKARMVAAAQGLSSAEAQKLTELEARLGKRVLDPRYLANARRIIVPLAATTTGANKSTSSTQSGSGSAGATVLPKPEDRSKVNKEKSTMPKPNKNIARRQLDEGVDDPQLQELVDVVAEGATADAQAIAQQITAIEEQIAAKQTQIDGLNQQIEAAGATTDAEGNPVDNTEQIAGLQTQLDAVTVEMEALQREVEALQAELAAVNQTATATGGEAQDPPAAGGGEGEGEGGAIQGEATRALAGARQLRSIITKHIAPMRTLARVVGGRRAVEESQLQPIIDALQAVLSDLQTLIADMGEEPERTVGDRVIFSALARANGGKPATFADVRSLVQDASAGRTYRKRLMDACVAAQVRALGASNVDEVSYRRMLGPLNIEGLEAEVRRYQAAAQEVFRGGRGVLPASLLTLGDEETKGEPEEQPEGVFAANRAAKSKSIVG